MIGHFYHDLQLLLIEDLLHVGDVLMILIPLEMFLPFLDLIHYLSIVIFKEHTSLTVIVNV